MPQLDFITFGFQSFWLSIFVILLFFILGFRFMTIFSKSIKLRNFKLSISNFNNSVTSNSSRYNLFTQLFSNNVKFIMISFFSFKNSIFKQTKLFLFYAK